MVDLETAFDKFNPTLVTFKKEKMLNFVGNFLRNRQIKKKAINSVSDETAVLSGVLQGK